jgi:uncharacterized protein YbjT (DUF2867 family)/ligand-binding SRPBCC domain-containing protein
VLLTGATGYVGGRLLGLLEARGLQVRCLARRPEALSDHGERTEIVAGDVLDECSLVKALQGVSVAYYLVHSMGSAGSFEREDRVGAANFARAARAAGVRRIVYLGGLGSGAALSSHLASRHEVGRILADSGVQTLEFRASIVVGSGSLSFEMIRALVERLPVMLTPSWVRTMAQPIAIDDVLDYLVSALDVEVEGSRVFEIGGADRVSYEDLMREYARQARRRMLVVPVPFLTPRLSSLWLGLVTPIYARVGRKLIDSLPHETVVHDESARTLFGIRPLGHREAIARALAGDLAPAPTRWSDAVSSAGLPQAPLDGVGTGRRFVDSRSIRVPVPPDAAFAPIAAIGGGTGWYFADWLWHLRGFIDLLAGGVGLRRGRRHPTQLVPGATLDFWRVEAIEPGRRLLLRAEMKLPGRASLEFEVQGDDAGATIRQTAVFDAFGRIGSAYWHALRPFHAWIFGGMLRSIGAEAVRRHSDGIDVVPEAGGTEIFEREQVVHRPLGDVFAFFSDAANLEAITPPELRFRILTPLPIEMRAGTTIDYQLSLHGLPFRWQTEIVEWEEGRRFVDVQRRGPYALWEHTHTFEAVNGGTLIRDRVRYRLPFGPLGTLVNRLRVRRDVGRIFDHRRVVIDRLLPPESASG